MKHNEKAIPHHIGGGFWAYIKWEKDGSKGIDHHGREWINKHNPECVTLPMLKAFCEQTAQVIELTTKAKLI